MTITLSAEVANALRARAAVVALESTLICHGFPAPDNLELAFQIEAAVRANGAIPATTAILDGHIKVGATPEELRRLALAPDVAKCTTRDLPLAIAKGDLGATTVAATLFVAAKAGIPTFATGGLGGVHRGAESSLDVSADLEQLARSPLAAVCSGAKSILDLPRTMERLETLGICVVGYRCSELPGFYTTGTGLPLPRVDEVSALCRVFQAHRRLDLPSAMVIAQLPPPEAAMDQAAVDHLVEGARQAARTAGVRGPAETPFMLRWMAHESGGATVRVNRALILANTALAAQVSVGLAEGIAQALP